MNMKQTCQQVMNRVKANPKLWAGVGAGVLVVVCLCWMMARTGRLLPRGAYAGENGSFKHTHSMHIPAGKSQEWAFEAPSSKTPGRLFGTWTSKAASATKTIGSDDTLAAFQIRGPKNETLLTADRVMEGSFDVRVEAPGKYTFWFDNGGFVRRSDRVIEIEATYQPN